MEPQQIKPFGSHLIKNFLSISLNVLVKNLCEYIMTVNYLLS